MAAPRLALVATSSVVLTDCDQLDPSQELTAGSDGAGLPLRRGVCSLVETLRRRWLHLCEGPLRRSDVWPLQETQELSEPEPHTGQIEDPSWTSRSPDEDKKYCEGRYRWGGQVVRGNA